MDREKVGLSDSPMSVLLKMAEGNPGAATVMGKLIADDPMGFIDVLHLDDMGMRGSQIWEAFKFCKQDIAALRKAIRGRDKAMVAHVNQHCPDRRAVEHGASFV